MENASHASHEPPHRHSHTGTNVMAILVGIVGGVGLFAGVMYWYFHSVEKPAPPLPGTPLGSSSRPAAGGQDGAPVLDMPVVEIEPLAEMHLKVVDGVVESIDAPSDGSLAVKLSGKEITITAAKDAKEGTRQIKVHGPHGKETVLTVNVKKKK